jgi:thiamine biosynthesis protein ThiI
MALAMKETHNARELKRKVICLVSGGIDSPVAAWLLARIGYTPIFVYFDNNPLSDETTKRRALESMARVMRHWLGEVAHVYVIPHGEDLIDIIVKCPRKLTCILCRRIMLKVAERIANLEGSRAIVTGEILGEHASQTLHNLVSINSASNLPILRPLIGMNKVEVERIARKIGTFDISTKPASCCRAAPKQPRTKARIEEVTSAENRLDIESMIGRALKNVKIETIGSPNASLHSRDP